jgi:hypothetical protein
VDQADTLTPEHLANTIGREFINRYLAKCREMIQRWGSGRVSATLDSFSPHCPIYNDPNTYELVVFGNGKIVPCCFMHNDPAIDIGTIHEDVMDLTSKKRQDRAKQLMNGVVAANYDYFMEQRGIVNCAECQESRRMLKERGEYRKLFIKSDMEALKEQLECQLTQEIDREVAAIDMSPEQLSERFAKIITNAAATMIENANIRVIDIIRATDGINERPDTPDEAIALPASMQQSMERIRAKKAKSTLT